jgi:Ca2+:H+ antiporter
VTTIASQSERGSASIVRREWPLAIDAGTAALFLVFGSAWLSDLRSEAWFTFVFVWLITVIAISAFAVVRHAECLAIKLGEPLGTLILTLAVTGVEVMMISAVMYAGQGASEFARDAMFAVVMIVLNGMIGLSLLLGGLKHREQSYNLQGASAFLGVIIPLAVLGLVMPNFTLASAGGTMSRAQATFAIVMSLALYGVFLVIQNLRHKNYFIAPPARAMSAIDRERDERGWSHAGMREGERDERAWSQAGHSAHASHAADATHAARAAHVGDAAHATASVQVDQRDRTDPAADDAHAHHGFDVRSMRYHVTFLLAYLIPLVLLAKQVGKPIQFAIDAWHAPAALGGLIVAALVLSPESMGAVRAARANELQRSVNILLGSVLATISLTIPAVLIIGRATHQTIVLGLDPVDTTLLVLTLAVSALTFSSAKTNVLSGAVHLLLFLAYVVLIFER